MPTPLSEHTTGSLIEQARHPHDHQSSSILVALALAWHRRDHPRIVELGSLQEFAFSALSAAALPGISRFPRYRQGIIIIPSSSARPRARYAEAESRADEAVRQRYEGFEIIDAAEAESDGQDNDEPFSVPTIRSGFSEDESDDAFSETEWEGQHDGAAQFCMLNEYVNTLETILFYAGVFTATVAVAFAVSARPARS